MIKNEQNDRTKWNIFIFKVYWSYECDKIIIIYEFEL